MLDNQHRYVALFVDWDNLAISIAADLGGATPDLRRIVHKAQEYGTVLVAKAYAEWQMTSDRLAVYRAGVEPVYAPTFRFEPDLAGQPSRGKSLADPCLVADCVDCLHLFPQVTTYVLVSGDKDLIPVVRIAQLRGKNVIVIGPDYAAGVLREMADEFISYRQLIEDIEPHVAAPEVARRDAGRSSRRHAAPLREAAVATAYRSGRGAVARERALPESVFVPSPMAPEPQPLPDSREPLATTPVEAPEASKKDSTEELKEVFRVMAEVLAERSQDGRAKLRATNLKDILMQRIAGFSERRYGFTKFKDLLLAARKAGVVDVTQAGPVHWVSLPDTTKRQASAAEASPAEATPVPERPPMPATSDNGETAPVVLSSEQGKEATQFIYELGRRSRWLTYTYVLTNLISHLGRELPPGAAEAAARSVLSYLVQENVLSVDKEPREVEVGGIKHRVRMCHLEQAHPWVQEIGSIEEETSEQEAVSAVAERSGTEAPTETRDELHVEGPPAADRPEEGVPSEQSQASGEGEPAPAADEEARESETQLMAAQEPGYPVLEQAVSVEAQVAEAVSFVEAGVAALDELDNAVIETQAERASDAGRQTTASQQNDESVIGWVNPSVDQVAAPAAVTATVEVGQESAEEAEPEAEAPPLEEAFRALDDIVRSSISAERPRLRAAGLKVRLSKVLGRFNERDYGFVRFKDFLMAADREGWVQAQIRGANTWVVPGSREAEQSRNN